MKILLLIAVIALAAFIIYAVIGYAQRDDEEPEEPVNPPRQLSDAEREAIRQAEDVFDFETRIAILQGTYTGPLPEHIAGGHWTELYPDIFHTKIAGINYRKSLGNLAGLFFNARIEPEPKNKYDKNAIKIVKADDGLHLGYIPADETSYVRQFINNDFTCHCEAFIEEDEDWDYDTEREKRFLYGYVNIHRPSSDNSTSVSPTA